MLYPDFKELLSYEKAAKGIGDNLRKKYSADVTGNFLSSFKGQGMEFDEVREYMYGDDVRDIEWRVSARNQQTYVKVYREERKRNVIIALDNNGYMHFGTRKTFKNVQAARIAAILGFAANHNMDRVGLYIFGDVENRFKYLKPVDNKKSLITGLKSLCVEKTENEDYSVEGAIFNLRRLGAKPNILFIISDFRRISESFEETLYQFTKRAEVVLINIIDDNDMYMPNIGRIMLEYDDNNFLLDTSNRRIIERYKKTFAEKQKDFRRIAAHLNARTININTKDDVLRELSLGLR